MSSRISTATFLYSADGAGRAATLGVAGGAQSLQKIVSVHCECVAVEVA